MTMSTLKQEQVTTTSWEADQAARHFAEGNARTPWLTEAAGATATAAIVTYEPVVYATNEEILEHQNADYALEHRDDGEY